MDLAIKLISAGLMLSSIVAFFNFAYWQLMLIGNGMNEATKRDPDAFRGGKIVPLATQNEAVGEIYHSERYASLRRKWAQSIGIVVLSFAALVAWGLLVAIPAQKLA